MTERRSPLSVSRRELLSIAPLAVATAMSAALPLQASPCREEKRSWIPSDAFLAMLPQFIDLVSVPGISMAVVDKAEVVWTRVMGAANGKTGRRVAANATFEAASMSKPVFAYVVMKLVDEKLLDLDRPLVQYCRPDWFADDPSIDLITARDALRHSTGLPNWRRRPQEKIKPAFKPGSRFGYSGEGYFWLQLAVEKITGQGLDTVMRTRLFEPAGLRQSTYAWNEEQNRWAVDGSKGPGEQEGDVPFQFNREMGNLLLEVAAKWGKPFSTWTYEDVSRAAPEVQALIRASGRWPKDIMEAAADAFRLPTNVVPNAAASLRSTPSEYARLMTLMMPRARRASWEISETSRLEMLTPQIQVKAGNPMLSRGLGWELEQQPSSEPLFRHGGANGGIFMTFGAGDATGRAIVVFTNGGGGESICARVCRAATGLDFAGQ